MAPFIIIAIGAVGALIVTAELSARGQDEALMRERGATVLEGTVQRLQERQKSLELLTQLLVQQRDLVTAVEERNDAALAQELRPLAQKLGMGAVEVYGADRERLLHLGPIEMAPDMERFTLSALSGGKHSLPQVSSEGLAVLASSPIEGPQGIIGALTVNTIVGADALEEAKSLDGADLAVFLDGTLVGTSVTDPDLAHLLRDSRLTPEKIEDLNRATESFNFHVVARPFGSQGILVALVPSKDIEQGTSQRDLLLLPVVLPLATAIVCMLLVALILARDMGAMFEAVVKLSRELVRGNYSQRLPASHIREVNELARAFNFLGRQLEVQRKKLEAQAFFDPLTGLPNRDFFVNRLKHALARASRNDSNVAVMFVDLDDFKLVNDSLGHQVGDSLLAEVARRLQSSLREVDTAARLGGDEFTVLIEDASDKKAVISLAERLQDRLGAPLTLTGRSVSVRASIGIAFSSPDHDRPEVLVREADAAMYRAKLGGKARCEVFDDAPNSAPEECAGLTPDLQQATNIESKPAPREFPSHEAPGYRSVTLSVWPRDEGLIPGVTPDLLANCQADVKSGRMTLEECLNAHPAEAEELRRLMETAAGVLPAPQARPAPAVPTRALAALMGAVADAAIATWRPLGRLWRSIAAGWKNRTRPIASGMPVSALVIALVLVLTTAGGGATYAAQSALPGDPLYPIKMTLEDLQFRLAPGDEGKAAVSLDCAGRRLDEAEKAIDFGRFSAAESAVEAYAGCLAQARRHLGQAEASGRDVGQLALRLSETLSGHQARLEGVGERLPEPARAALSKAVDEETVAIRSAETPNTDRDEVGPEPAPTIAISNDEALNLTQTISDVQTLKNDPEVPGESSGGMLARLLAAPEAVDRGHGNAALNQLETCLNQLNAMRRSGLITGGDYAALCAGDASLGSQLGGTAGSPAAPGSSTPRRGPREEKPQPGDRLDNSDDRTHVSPTVAPGSTGQQGRPDPNESSWHQDDSQPQMTPVVEPTEAPSATTPAPDTDTHGVSGGRTDVSPPPVAAPEPPPRPPSQAPAPPSAGPGRPQTGRPGNSKKPPN